MALNRSVRATLCCNNLCLVSRFCMDRRKVVGSRSKQMSKPPRGHQANSDGVRVRFRVRFQAVKVPIFGGIPVENPTKKANRLKALLRGISLSEYGPEGFQVRLRRLSEYGSVAYLVERPTRETQHGTVPGHRPTNASSSAHLRRPDEAGSQNSSRQGQKTRTESTQGLSPGNLERSQP